MCASIAQLAEQRIFNPWVRGSIPRGGTLPSPAGGGLSVERDWCPQRAVNSPPSGMGGSIPSRRTHCHLRVRAEAPSLSDDGSPAFGQGSTRWCNWQARPALVREATGSSPVRVARHSLRGGKAEVPMLFDNRIARLAKLADALDSGSSTLQGVRVRVSGRARVSWRFESVASSKITRRRCRWRRSDQHSRRVRLPFPGIDRRASSDRLEYLRMKL